LRKAIWLFSLQYHCGTKHPGIRFIGSLIEQRDRFESIQFAFRNKNFRFLCRLRHEVRSGCKWGAVYGLKTIPFADSFVSPDLRRRLEQAEGGRIEMIIRFWAPAVDLEKARATKDVGFDGWSGCPAKLERDAQLRLVWVTALSGYRYTVLEERDGKMQLEYQGARNGFLRQNLLPPEWADCEPVLISVEGTYGSLGGYRSLDLYDQLRNDWVARMQPVIESVTSLLGVQLHDSGRSQLAADLFTAVRYGAVDAAPSLARILASPQNPGQAEQSSAEPS